MLITLRSSDTNKIMKNCQTVHKRWDEHTVLTIVKINSWTAHEQTGSSRQRWHKNQKKRHQFNLNLNSKQLFELLFFKKKKKKYHYLGIQKRETTNDSLSCRRWQVLMILSASCETHEAFVTSRLSRAQSALCVKTVWLHLMNPCRLLSTSPVVQNSLRKSFLTTRHQELQEWPGWAHRF